MPQIYVIYRPEDSRKRSQEIIESLKKLYGTSSIKYPDYDGYVDVYQIERDVQKSHYLLVIIGNYWADMVDESGQNLLASVYDPVHMAIATAINSRKRMIPILIDGADMPRQNRLPRELRAITTQEPIKIAKNASVHKALSKGLKDIIKRNPISRLPDFNLQMKLPKRSVATPHPRLRQPVRPQGDWQYWVKRGVLPTVAIAIIVISVALMLIPETVETTVVSYEETVPVSLATIAPTTTATVFDTPQIVTPQRTKITVDNAGDIQLFSQEEGNLSSNSNFIFSGDESLFIFVSVELQEVQLIDVATNDILRVIEFAPETPLYVALNADETRLYVYSSGGISTWGIAE